MRFRYGATPNRVALRVHRLIGAVCFLVPASCLSDSDARPSGYAVSYAFDVGDVTDLGKAACDYGSACEIESRRLKLSVSLVFSNPDHREVTILTSGQDDHTDCRHFSGGATSIKRKVNASLIRLNVYEQKRSAANRLSMKGLESCIFNFWI